MTPSRPNISASNLGLGRRDRVIQALAGFAGKSVRQWLPSTHRASTAEFLRTNGKPFRSYRQFKQHFTPADVADVLAATGPSHCIDGWTYFSRAIAALLAGDTHTARHLSYYAQLRAALCLLHCHGVGIFNGINFAIDQAGNLHRIDMNNDNRPGLGTHSAVWPVLQRWASNPHVSSAFLDSIEFRGVSLSDCLDAVWPSGLTTPLMSDVIAAWGVDLRRPAEDHDSRNISSYAAHAFNPATSDLSTRLELVRQIWLGFEPDGRGGFPTLDRHLLRRFFRLMDRQHSRIGAPTDWNLAYPRLDPRTRDFVSQQFVESPESPSDFVILTHADNTLSGEVHAMISRALLLRTATSVVRKAFLDAGFDPLAENVPPWFESVGTDRGFWQPDDQPEQVEDLWDVVGHAVSDLSNRLSANITDQASFLDELKPQTVLLSQTERACMWGVCA